MAEEIKKCFLQFSVPSIDDMAAIAIEEEHKVYTIEQIIEQLAVDHDRVGRPLEAKSIRDFKNQDLVINGQAINLNTKIQDLPFVVTTTTNGRVMFARVDVDTTHVMG